MTAQIDMDGTNETMSSKTTTEQRKTVEKWKTWEEQGENKIDFKNDFSMDFKEYLWLVNIYFSLRFLYLMTGINLCVRCRIGFLMNVVRRKNLRRTKKAKKNKEVQERRMCRVLIVNKSSFRSLVADYRPEKKSFFESIF